MITLAQSAVLMSIFKPLVMAVVLIGWAWVAGKLDKDAAYFYLPRRPWNSVQISAAVVAFGLWLLIPFFWLGLPLALAILGGAIFGYAYYRNQKVPANEKWSFSLDSFKGRIESIQQERAQKAAEIRLLNADGSVREVPAGGGAETQAHAVMEQVLEFAIPRGAQAVDLHVDAQQAAMSVTIDGAKYPQPAVEPRLALALVDYLKGAAGLDVTERRRKQAGTLLVDAGELGRHTLALTTAGSTKGVDLTIEVDPEARTQIKFDHLGLLAAQRQQIEPVLKEGGGVVLVAAPPGHGLSTVLYSLLQQHDPYTQSIVTLEERVEFEIEGVAHHTIDPTAGADGVAQKVTAMLRQDPRVFLISRLTDAPIARAAAKGARETRFYIGVRDLDTFAALRTWTKAVGEPSLAGGSLAAIVAIRLVRKLCPTCRIAYKPDPVMLKKLNLPPERVGQLYKHSGQVMVKDKAVPCPDCLGVGYRGRMGVAEVMVLDDEARALAAAGKVDQLRSHLRKNKMLWLQEAGLAKVVEGITSISEITRALGGDPAAKPQAAAAAPAKPA